jgi:hypothetical protein
MDRDRRCIVCGAQGHGEKYFLRGGKLHGPYCRKHARLARRSIRHCGRWHQNPCYRLDTGDWRRATERAEWAGRQYSIPGVSPQAIELPDGKPVEQ